MSSKRYWMCIIGPIEHGTLPVGSDEPMRDAVEEVFHGLTGKESKDCWSGWGLTEERMQEVQEVWNRESPKPDENADQARLGFATTAELLDELRARIEVAGQLGYRTVDGDSHDTTPRVKPGAPGSTEPRPVEPSASSESELGHDID